MKETTPREKMLKKIRAALIYKSPEPVLNSDKKQIEEAEGDDVKFAKNFSENGGKFVFCESLYHISDDIEALVLDNEWKNVFCNDKDIAALLTDKIPLVSASEIISSKEPQAAILLCDLLIADSGSVIISSNHRLGVPFTQLPDMLIVVAGVEQVVPNWKMAVKELSEIYSGKSCFGTINVMNGKKNRLSGGKEIIGKDIILFLVEKTAI